MAFQIFYATGAYTAEELKTLNSPCQRLHVQVSRRPPGLPPGAPEVNAQVRLGPGESFGREPAGRAEQRQRAIAVAFPGPPPPNAIPTATDGVQWFDIKKNFGPLNLSRVGFKLGTSGGVELTGYLDGGLSMMGLTVELLGLTVSTTLTGANRFKPTFGLNGLGIDFKSGPLEIGGALYKLDRQQTSPSSTGWRSIRTETLQLSAIGSFAELSGATSRCSSTRCSIIRWEGRLLLRDGPGRRFRLQPPLADPRREPAQGVSAHRGGYGSAARAADDRHVADEGFHQRQD